MTLVLDDDLYSEAKKAACAGGLTVSAFVEMALRETLLLRRGRRLRPLHLPVCGGGKLRPGVELDDSAGLLDIMEKPFSQYRGWRFMCGLA